MHLSIPTHMPWPWAWGMDSGVEGGGGIPSGSKRTAPGEDQADAYPTSDGGKGKWDRVAGKHISDA